MIAAFALALLVRAAYLAAFRPSPFFDAFLVDAAWHDSWAWEWARGDWSMEGQAFFRAPLYPLWLAAQYLVFGHDLLAVRVVDAVLGASTAAALAGAGVRWAGPRVGGAAGILAALYGPLIHFGGELLIPNLLTALLSWGTFFLLARGGASFYVGALLWGLAGIARPNAIVLLVLLVPLARRAGFSGAVGAPGPASGWPGRASAAALLALTPAFAVTAVNVAVEGEPVFVAGQGGVNFAIGNHALASGRGVELPGLDNLASWREFRSRSRAVAEAAEGRELSSLEVSDFWVGWAGQWIREHPGDAAALTLRKAFYLFHAVEIPNNRDLYFDRRGPLRPLLWKTPWLAFPWGVAFPLAVVGMVYGFRTRFALTGTLVAWIGLYAATLIPFFICARFRMGMVPPVLLLAALALGHARGAFRGGALVAGLAALVLVNLNLFDVRQDTTAQERTKLGALLLEAGKMEEGMEELEGVLETDPNRLAAVYMLADAHLERGEFEAAARRFEHAVSLRPGDPRLRFSLGAAYLGLERYEGAAASLEVAAMLDPGDAATWINLGVAYEGQLRKDQAAAAYSRGLDENPRAELGYLRWGELLLDRGDAAAAVGVLHRGVSLLRMSVDLRLSLARAHLEAGNPALAQEELDAVYELDHDNPRAVELQEELRRK